VSFFKATFPKISDKRPGAIRRINSICQTILSMDISQRSHGVYRVISVVYEELQSHQNILLFGPEYFSAVTSSYLVLDRNHTILLLRLKSQVTLQLREFFYCFHFDYL
jgi:hypothetical protein